MKAWWIIGMSLWLAACASHGAVAPDCATKLTPINREAEVPRATDREVGHGD